MGRRLKDIEPASRQVILRLRGMYQLAHRLVEVPQRDWPQMYIQEEVLALRVPPDSPLKRHQFMTPAQTMGLGLLFAHGLDSV